MQQSQLFRLHGERRKKSQPRDAPPPSLKEQEKEGQIKIKEVEQDLLPNRLCDYLYQLSDKFNKFYENCPVLKSEEPARTSRLMLCDLTAKTLKLGLSLLGIKVLERM